MMHEVKLEKELNLRSDFNLPTYEEWKAKVVQDLKGANFDKKLITVTYEGIPLKPLYTRDDIKELKFKNAYPGFGKYNRGTKASGDVKKHWLISTSFNYGLAEQFNEAVLHDLPRGLEAIILYTDRATQQNKNCDSVSKGEVGKDGVSISDGASLRAALKNLNPTEIPLYIEAGFSALPLTLMYLSLLKEKQIDIKSVKGGITSDPVEYILKRGSVPIDLNSVFNEITAATKLFAGNENFATVGVSSVAINNSGGSAVQELAYALATAVYYVEELLERGISPDVLCNKIKFKFGVNAFYFMEIAKLRAFKMLWNVVAKEYGMTGKPFIHARTTEVNQTKFDPHVNMLRTTTEAFSAILGGVDLLETNAYNETLGEANEFGRRIARNTQIILREETHLDKLIDPAGGSFFVETLTGQLTAKSWELFKEIQNQGGIVKAIEKGFIQNEVAQTMDKRKKDLAKRKQVLVGTNMYANPKEESPVENAVDYEKAYLRRKEQIEEFKQKYDLERQAVLTKLKALKTPVNIGLDAIDENISLATIEDIADALRTEVEKGIEVAPLASQRLAEDFEQLRLRANGIAGNRGRKPEVFLINYGTVKEYKARADYSRGFFEVGGFKVKYPKGFDNADDAVTAALESKADVAVICSTDENYGQVAVNIAGKIKSNGSNMKIILAGNPRERMEEYRNGGIDGFIYIGINALSVLSDLLNSIENK